MKLSVKLLSMMFAVFFVLSLVSVVSLRAGAEANGADVNPFEADFTVNHEDEPDKSAEPAEFTEPAEPDESDKQAESTESAETDETDEPDEQAESAETDEPDVTVDPSKESPAISVQNNRIITDVETHIICDVTNPYGYKIKSISVDTPNGDHDEHNEGDGYWEYDESSNILTVTAGYNIGIYTITAFFHDEENGEDYAASDNYEVAAPTVENGDYIKGSKEDLIFKIKNEPSHIVTHTAIAGEDINSDVTIDSEYWSYVHSNEKNEGVLTLKYEYLETLPAGGHVLIIGYEVNSPYGVPAFFSVIDNSKEEIKPSVNNGDYTKGRYENLLFTINNEPEGEVEKILIDNSEVDSGDWAYEDGGKLALGYGFLDTLSKGKHNLTIVYTDGAETSRVIASFNVIIAKVENGNYNKGSEKNLPFKITYEPAGAVVKVLIDNKEVDSAEWNYVDEGGYKGTLTLKYGYLEKLSTGKHTIEMVYDGIKRARVTAYDNGADAFSASGSFGVSSGSTGVDTSDHVPIGLGVLMFLSALAYVCGYIFMKARRAPAEGSDAENSD